MQKCIVKGLNMNYYTYMNRNQIKSALLNCARTHNITLTELAREAGVAPSTISGFVNDSKSGGRDQHFLSTKTINKLSLKFPDLSKFLKIAEPFDSDQLKEVRVIGLVDFEDNQKIAPLDMNTPAAINIAATNEDYIAFRATNVHVAYDGRYYLCRLDPIEDENEFQKHLTKLCIVDCKEGRYMGFLFRPQNDSDGKFYLSNICSETNQLPDCTDIKWIAPVLWSKP